MKAPIQGVNLGGWLVLEKWITPELFLPYRAEDEHGLVHELGSRAGEVIGAHRDIFVTEDDFAWMSSRGLEAVRLPLGYWVFGSKEPYLECAGYVDKAFEWAEKHDIKVLLDFHAAPGSQNGWDHSGQAGKFNWHRHETNIDLSLGVLKELAQRYGDHGQLLGIEVLNEPHWNVPMHALLNYYERAYDILDPMLHGDSYIVFHDGFRPHEMAPRLASMGFQRACMDMHLYQVFGKQYAGMSLEQHIEYANERWSKDIDDLSRSIPIVIGEWSASLPGEAFSANNSEDQKRAGHLRYAEAQKAAFKQTAGEFYWTYKAASAGTWSLKEYPEYIK